MLLITPKDLLTMDPEALLLPGEVAMLFRVDPKTVTRWAAAGKIPSRRTFGGHRRFRVGDVQQKLKLKSERETSTT